MLKTLLDLFPNAKKVEAISPSASLYYIPLDEGEWLAIAKQGLTPQEDYLLNLLQARITEEIDDKNPWYRYLIKAQGQVPEKLSKIQFLHCHIESRKSQGQFEGEWLTMMTSIIPNILTYFYLSKQDIVFLIDQEPFLPIKSLLDDVTPSLEFDFEMKLSFLIGQIWSQHAIAMWPALCQEEQALFQNFMETSKHLLPTCLPALLLKNKMTGSVDTSFLFQQIRYIIEVEGMEEIVQALWQEQAVITKAAQVLYIHRNSLQYRLDKFYEQTGLSLRQMDDLSIAYLALLN